MKIEEFWPLVLKAIHDLGAQYEQRMYEKAVELELETPGYFWLLALLTFEPDPVSPAMLRVRSPYTAPKWYAERMANAAARGFLRAVGQEGYLLTDKGRLATQMVVQAAYDWMADLAPMAQEKLERLASLLGRLVEACAAAPDPPGTWCIAHSLKVDPGTGAHVIVQIDQYLSDLAAYRDDAHLASWHFLDVDGPAWEALTVLWRQNGPLSLDELFDQFKRRGWEKADYLERLEGLADRRWVAQTGDTFEIILPGVMVRQDAEKLTDTYFYRPWVCVGAEELNELEGLLLEFHFYG
jgi:hypothetical protein